MSTYDVEETDMTERQALLDFPGAEALQAAGRVEPLSARALARALAAVEEAVQEETVKAPREKVVVTPFRRRRRVLAVVAAAAVAAGVAVTYADTGAGSSGTRHETQAESASVFLNDIAEVAATQPAGSGTYWKVRTRTGTTYISRSMELTYTATGGTGLKRHFRGWQLGSKQLDWNSLDSLTTDPVLLRRSILSAQKGPWEEDAGTVGFEQASILLSSAPASPELRAGLFKALSTLRGVTNAGTVKDAAGRSGTKLVFHGAIGTTEVIIDPKTSTLLELDTPWKSDRNDQRVTVLSAGLTDTTG
ncbi:MULTISPECIES: hypothetical protein [unclassified Streptomyces]|uniref:hypothetical protein n=1 Tax=unclassified Streptomyces TaxID=2593676 RepID=UPI0038201C42